MGATIEKEAAVASGTALGEVRPEHDAGGVPTDLMQLYYVRGFAVPIVDMWELLTEPAGLATWFGTMAGDPLDGPVTITTHHDSMRADDPVRAVEVAVVACTSPRSLDLTIADAIIELRLHQVGVVTTLEVYRRHLRRDEVATVGPYWQFYLDRLGAAVDGRDMPQWSDYLDLASEYPCPG
jgi:uncharacterized protein YndB with AHSA1/START domain